jgi:rRNA maturation protein Rpf1
VGVVLFAQILQKKTHFHENKHDGRYKHVVMLNQDSDNQEERNYNLRTHMKMNKNPTYKHDMDAKMKNKDTQKYIENHNQEYNERDTQIEIDFGGQE